MQIFDIDSQQEFILIFGNGVFYARIAHCPKETGMGRATRPLSASVPPRRDNAPAALLQMASFLRPDAAPPQGAAPNGTTGVAGFNAARNGRARYIQLNVSKVGL